MGKRQKNLKILVDCLRKLEREKTSFTAQSLAKMTGVYRSSAIASYLSKKLINYLVFKQGDNTYRCQGLERISDDVFLAHMSQSGRVKVISDEEKMRFQLIDRSLDAFMLSLEVYNRPSLRNRVEAFTIMMVNAWELLLKAEVIRYHGKPALFKSQEYSVSVGEAVALRMQVNDPARKNLDVLVDLRDNAIHLLLPELQSELSRLFQANVMNYQGRYRNETGCFPLAGQSVGMLSLVIDGPKPEIAKIKQEYGDITAKAVSQFLERFRNIEREQSSDKFAVSMEYRLVLCKNPRDGDMSLSLMPESEGVVIVEKPKDIAALYPFRATDAIKEINARLKGGNINSYDFNAVLCKHKKKGDQKYHYCIPKPETHFYSMALIDWFAKNVTEHAGWLSGARDWYKKSQKSSGKKT